METDHGIADGLAISEEHRQLAQSARAVLADRDARGAARAALEAAPAIPQPPAFWKDVVSLGWLGLHIPETRGGQGSGLPELAVVVEQLGRAAAPGPFVPTALASALVAECGDAADQSRLLPELLGGAVPAPSGCPMTCAGGAKTGTRRERRGTGSTAPAWYPPAPGPDCSCCPSARTWRCSGPVPA